MPRRSDDQIYVDLEPHVTKAGLFLEKLVTYKAGKRTRLVVTVDAETDEALDLDEIAKVSKSISELLDEDESINGTYVLEVTTPGIDRPLTLPHHWNRARGRLVQIDLKNDGTSEPETLLGRVLESSESAVVVEIDGDKVEVPLATVELAVVQVEFNRSKSKG